LEKAIISGNPIPLPPAFASINQFGISISPSASYEIADLSGKFDIIENIPQQKLLCGNHRREDWFRMRSPQIEFQPKNKMRTIRSEIYFT
jgi:hypothetical protein